ncbi:MAG: hypothetical protein ABL897_07515 [Hyphomicrobium sp.]
MLDRVFVRRFSRWREAIASPVIAGFTALRSFDERIRNRSIAFSGTYGADLFSGPDATNSGFDQELSVADEDACWDAALDFSLPKACAVQDFPRCLQHRAAEERASEAVTLPGPQCRLHRPVTLVIASILVLAWIGTGSGNPLQPARNPAADTVAEKFARPDSAINFDDAQNNAVLTDVRFDFASRLSGFYSANDGFGIDAADEPVFTESNAPDLTADPLASDIGLVMIRRLPVGSVLSSGARVSPTDWALTRSDLKSVVVTLPAGRQGQIKADIEVYAMAGSPAGTMTVEIRQPKAPSIALSRRARAPRSAIQRAAVVQEKNAPQPVKTPAATAKASQPMALIAQQPALPQLPFLPGPMTGTVPPQGETVGNQILINLGAVARPPPRAAATSQ